MPVLRDLVTVVYRPRETMRRILGERDRWAPQIVILAFVCASFQDSDLRKLGDILPGLGNSALAIIVLSLVVGSALWVIALYLLSWLTTFVGGRMGGVATAPDVRAALAWGMVPVIWSIVYRIPLGIAMARFVVTDKAAAQVRILDVLAEGGCSLLVIYVTLQFVFAVWCLYVGSACLAEAQQFPTGKGFLNIAIALAAPFVIGIAAVLSSR